MNFLLLGSSGGLGRALAESLAQRGHNLMLIASDERDLIAQSAHLHIKYGIRVDYLACHLTSESNWLDSIIDKVQQCNFHVEGLFLPIGFSSDEDNGGHNEKMSRQLAEVNFLGLAALISYFLPGIMSMESGYIIGFGSIASARGRKNNVMYSASKRALSSYFESVRHLVANTKIKVHFYQMGYIDTQQAFGRSLLLPKSRPEDVAEAVCNNMNKDIGEIYYPFYWRYICLIVKLLPWKVFRKLNF